MQPPSRPSQPATPQQVTVVFRPGQEEWARIAAEFAARGPAVRLVPLGAQDVGADRVWDRPVIDLTRGQPGITGAWRVTDVHGQPLTDGVAAARAVRSGVGHLSVQLRHGDRILAQGRTKARRTVAGTVHSAMLALGPLAVRSALASSGTDAAAAEAGARSPEVGSPGRDRGRSSATWRDPRLADALSTGRVAVQAARGAVTCRSWRVARWPAGLPELIAERGPLGRLAWHGPKRTAFWADPHVVLTDAQEWLFVEELDRGTGLGRIRACRFQAGQLVAGAVVLSTEHHLSFPQVYRANGRWLATAETCAAHNPIYTFDRIGDPWRPAGDLALPDHLADPVLLLDEAGAPTEAWGSDARLDPDAVFVRYQRHGDAWTRLDGDTAVDVTRGRAGGNLDLGRDLRAVQDCGQSYGVAAELVSVRDGSTVRRLTAGDVGRGDDLRRRKGVHTITWDPSGQAVWIDGWHRRPTLFGARLRLRESRHGQHCAG